MVLVDIDMVIIRKEGEEGNWGKVLEDFEGGVEERYMWGEFIDKNRF